MSLIKIGNKKKRNYALKTSNDLNFELNNLELTDNVNNFVELLIDRMKSNNIEIDFSYSDIQKDRWVVNAVLGSNSDENTSKLKHLWRKEIPVLIDSQTGTGKNTFIKNNLVMQVINDIVNGKRILILTNRIALSRQTKKDYAKFLRKFPNLKNYEELLKKFSNALLDEYIDFGSITLCTYHQCYNKSILTDKNEYAYIVCDECHFFTSDADFNVDTDKILEYIVMYGKNAVRIYMTATIETAMEAIVRTETKLLDSNISIIEGYSDIIKQPSKEEINRINLTYKMNYSYDFQYGSTLDAREIHSEQYINERISEYQQPFRFYYMNRNYDYIENIYVFRDYEELSNLIKKSNEKWLIFAQKLPNKKEKVIFEDMAKTKKVMFLSRDNVDELEGSKNSYDNLIEDEAFGEDCLFSTAILDNGINIDDEKVNHVVINVFERVEFLQMLGRVRIKDDRKINLYIREYSLDEIKKMLVKNVNLLTIMLQMDLLNKNEQYMFYKNLLSSKKYRYKKHHPVEMFRISNDAQKLYEYNVNAVYKLMNMSIRLMRLIRQKEENYVIELNTDFDDYDRLLNVRNYYENNPEGMRKSWSKDFLDLTETKATWKNKNDFLDCLYVSFISSYFNDRINNRIKDLINKYSFLEYEYKKITNGKKYTSIETLKIMRDILDLTGEPINISIEEGYAAKIEYYRNWANMEYSEHFSLDEQVSWIERKDYKFIDDILKPNNPKSDNINQENVQSDTTMYPIEIKIITEEEFDKEVEKYDSSNKSRCFNEKFLKEYGYGKDADEAKYIESNYFNNKSLTTIIRNKETAKINGKTCTIKSTLSSNKDTYYFVIEMNKETDINGQEPKNEEDEKIEEETDNLEKASES